MKTWIVACTLFVFANSLFAKNYPCSGNKGGVSDCQNGKFVCYDGSFSVSKKTCNSSLYNRPSKNIDSDPSKNQTEQKIKRWVDSHGTIHFSY